MVQPYMFGDIGIEGKLIQSPIEFGDSNPDTGHKFVAVEKFDYRGMVTYLLKFSNGKMNVLGTPQLKAIREGIFYILSNPGDAESLILADDPFSPQAGGNLEETKSIFDKENYMGLVKERLLLASEINHHIDRLSGIMATVTAEGSIGGYGGGFERALWGRLPMVTTEDYKGCLPEILIGILAGYAGLVNAYRLSPENVEYLAFTGDQYTAKDFQRAGIVGKIIEPKKGESPVELQRDIIQGTLDYLCNFHRQEGEFRIGHNGEIGLLRPDHDLFLEEISYRSDPNNFKTAERESLAGRRERFSVHKGTSTEYMLKPPISPESLRLQKIFLDYLGKTVTENGMGLSTKYELAKVESLLDSFPYKFPEFFLYVIESRLNKTSDPKPKRNELIVDFSGQPGISEIKDIESMLNNTIRSDCHP
ncbi:MAG TPA: hypothetical protein VI564_03325 [Candidatus Nanoarchaeia archaeon]|nr:hypothetical protein [Candidatus Nanoarchaeia archaeon]